MEHLDSICPNVVIVTSGKRWCDDVLYFTLLNGMSVVELVVGRRVAVTSGCFHDICSLICKLTVPVVRNDSGNMDPGRVIVQHPSSDVPLDNNFWIQAVSK